MRADPGAFGAAEMAVDRIKVAQVSQERVTFFCRAAQPQLQRVLELA